MPLLFQVLASGSKGNAILICSPRTQILLDAGLTGKELVRRLDSNSGDARHIDALVVSHEHHDHVRGLGVLSRRFDIPVYLSRGTLEGLPQQTGQLAHLQLFQTGAPFSIGDVKIQAFAISHDAKEPVGFLIEHECTKLGVCTDLGIATQLVKTRLQGCHGLILEANHDTDMLLNGPYPWYLKQRIRSRHGHLSNLESLQLLQDLYHEDLRTVVFAHLSEMNNQPDLVIELFREVSRRCQWHDLRLEIGSQQDVLSAVELL